MTSPSAPDLGSVVTSATARKVIYGVYVIAALLIGATQVGFAAVQAGQPDWLTAAIAVIAYAGIPVGALAAVNTPSRDTPPITKP